MIALKNVSKSYDGRSILDIPELVFEEGRRYALIGVNGSGKSTLLRMLAGTLLPDKGEVVRLPADGMGYMPQSPYAFGFSVQKNVEIAVKAADAPERALRALEAVGMLELAQAHGNKLSGGETQRMAFARMVAIPRKLLLLDELTSATDIKGTDQIEDTLLRYAAETGCTVILSTHSPAQALRLAEITIFLDRGRVAEQGPSEKLLKNPRQESTRLFLQHWRL